MKKESFNNLLRRIRDGDMFALESIYREFYVKIKSKAAMILCSDEEGEDAAGEAMLKLIDYARADEFKPVQDPGGFMYTLAKNTALNIKKHKRYTVNIDYIDEQEFSDDCLAAAFDNMELREIFKSLSESERSIAYLYYVYGCRIKFISEELNMPIGTVKWRLKSVREKFLKIF